MKTENSSRMMTLLGVAVLMVAMLAGSASAQSRELRVDVAFPFYAGNELMPAASYVMVSLANGNAIRLQSPEKATTLPVMPRENKLAKSRLVFTRYGDMVFLTELHWGEFSVGREIPKSNLEQLVQEANSSIRVAILPKR